MRDALVAWTEEIRVITGGLDTRTRMFLEPEFKDALLSNARSKGDLGGNPAPR